MIDEAQSSQSHDFRGSDDDDDDEEGRSDQDDRRGFFQINRAPHLGADPSIIEYKIEGCVGDPEGECPNESAEFLRFTPSFRPAREARRRGTFSFPDFSRWRVTAGPLLTRPPAWRSRPHLPAFQRPDRRFTPITHWFMLCLWSVARV